MNTSDVGKQAEKLVAKYLTEQGHQVLATNWKSKRCEIDIVTQKDARVYFIEVKYRANKFHGSGLDYITPRKLKQMHFAAQIWIATNNWEGDAILLAAEVDSQGQVQVVEV